MIDELDKLAELDDMDKPEDQPTQYSEEITESNAYDKSLDLVKESMKKVIAEFMIKLKDGSDHIVYITKFEVTAEGKMTYDWCTPSEDRKEELQGCVDDIFLKMIEEQRRNIKLLSF